MADSDITLSSTTGLPSAPLTPRSVDRGSGVREPVHSLAKQDGTRIDPATAQGQASMLTALGTLALSTDVQAGTAKAEASRALLAGILTAIQAQRVETIWTDDTGTRFIRVDIGGSIVWTDVAGVASSAPGTGARPDSDSGTVVSRTSYQATANGTGYATGDFLDHIVVTDGDAGDLVSNFWINVTAGTRVSAPPASNITPMSVLPTGAATQATLEALRALVAAGVGVTGPLTDGQLRANPVAITGPVDTVVRATSTNRGGTIATGGTAQQAMAANAARRGFVIQNQSSGDLYISGLGTATLDQNSLKIAAGGYYETPPHHVSTGAISIIGATTGQAFYGREF